MQNLESALTPYHMAYMFHLFRLTGGFQFCLQVCLQRRTVERYYAHLRDSVDGSQWKRLQLFSPPWWTAGENRFNPRWKSLNKRAKSSKPFQVCSRPRCPSYRWREGTGAWHALAAVVMVAGWSVASPAPALSLCRSGCLFSLLFSFSTSPSSLCLRVSIPPSPSSPSPFSLPSSAAPRLFLCLLSSQILPRLTELPALLYFSPDISVLFEVSLLSVLLTGVWLENQTGVRRLVSF